MLWLRCFVCTAVLFLCCCHSVFGQQSTQPEQVPTAQPAADGPPKADAVGDQNVDAEAGATGEPDNRDVKSQLEVDKLREEVRKLRTGNESYNWTKLLTLATTVLTIVIGSAGVLLNFVQRKKLQQDLYINERQHLLDVFKELGSDDPKVRMGAVAVLARELRELAAELKRHDLTLLSDGADVAAAHGENIRDKRYRGRTVTSVLVSVTKFESTEEIQKYIADNVAKALKAIVPEEKCECDLPDHSPMKDESFDFQGARLTNAWWKRIDGRDVDFYGSTLVRASLRQSFLNGANFSTANVRLAVFEDALLRNTNFRRANLAEARLARADLSGARLQEADLTDADLSGADLVNADLTGAVLTRANLSPAAAPDPPVPNRPVRDRYVTRADSVILNDTNLDGADLRGVDLRRARVQGPFTYQDAITDRNTRMPPDFEDS